LRSGSSMRGRKRSSGRRSILCYQALSHATSTLPYATTSWTSRNVGEALSWTRDVLSLKRLCPLCLCPRGQRVATLQSHSICHHDDISPFPPPPTRLPSPCFMISTINDIPTFGECWSHSVSLLSQLARNRHLAQHREVSEQWVKASLPSACPYTIKIILLVLIDLLQVIVT
jgi:hypothetical protein